MKLHHIEAFNLNSLYGEHSVDLDATLDGASLFLIYGPTGSGKSTLMDAVSLALFGMTPRLDAEHGNESADPRAIMSRGTGECSATVVFSKIENGGRQVYRARWTCRRARRKPDGALQRAERSLERRAPDGSWELMASSNKKKDYAPVFEEVLEEFGVRDFNRSMLLAQGQFDAFLGAPPEERAEILERLTDTSIYQQLGERAARIHRRHGRRLEALRTLAAAGGGLDAEPLAELKLDHERNTDELDRKKQAYEKVEGWLEWFDADIELRGQLAEVVGEQETLVEDAREAEDGLARLAEHERCEEKKAFQFLDTFASAHGEVTRLLEQIKGLDKSMPGLEKAAERLERKVEAATTSEKLAVGWIETLRPLVEAAEKASADHSAAVELAKGTAAEWTAAEEEAGEVETTLTEATDAVSEAKGKAVVAQAALDDHAADGKLASGWDAIRTRLDQLVTIRKRVHGDGKALEEREDVLAEDRAELDQDRTAHKAAHETAVEPRRAVLKRTNKALQQLLSHPEFETSRKKAADAVERERSKRVAVQMAEAPVVAASTGAGDLESVRKKVEACTGKLEGARRVVKKTEGTVDQAGVLESRSAGALERTRRVAELVEHRSALVDGEECPLCGAEEHPWAHDAERASADAVVGEAVAEAERALKDARKVHEDAKRAHRESEVRVRELSGQLELLRDQETQEEEAQIELERAATAAREEAGLSRDGSKQAVEKALRRATRRTKKAEEALAALDEARSEVDEAERSLRAAVEARKETDAELRERKAALKERQKQLDKDRDAHAKELRASVDEQEGCRALLEQHGVQLVGDDPVSWRDLGDQRCDEHHARVKAVTDLGRDIDDLEGRWKLLKSHRDKLVTRNERLAKKLGKEQSDGDTKCGLAERARDVLDLDWHAALASDDSRPTDGLPPVDASPGALLEAQKTWCDLARAAAEEAANVHRETLDELKTAQTQKETLVEQQAGLDATRMQARSKLDAALAGLTLSGDKELGALRLDDDQLADLRRTRKDLDDRKLEVETRIRERQKLVDAKALTRPAELDDDPDRDALAAQVADATEQRDLAAKSHQETGDRLRDHDRAVQDQEENRRKLREAEQEARVWQTLHQYIGVNDGGKFKEFAQALNLGQLLDKANVHLARLLERYRLIPCLEDSLPTLEFDLSDLWRVGERVAPRSLSGGERFLVSLALALGLSDFRAVKMPIETLLLDEGFGTLDPDTLSVALGALSQLQADGRQVGIISHVVGLRERIEARIEVRPLGGGRSEVR